MRVIAVILGIALLLAACGQEAEQTDDGRIPAEDALLMTASTRLITTFSQQLKGELLAAMNEGGAVGAIGVCQVRAPEIAAANSNEFVTIRRVSDRNRNPDNAASEFEQLVMSSLAETSDTMPAHSYSWEDGANGKVFQFYQPIRVAPLCTKCHGGEADIEPDVKVALAKMYPDDKATGYVPGDLRGLFVVEIQWPQGKSFVETLVGEGGQTTQSNGSGN